MHTLLFFQFKVWTTCGYTYLWLAFIFGGIYIENLLTNAFPHANERLSAPFFVDALFCQRIHLSNLQQYT